MNSKAHEILSQLYNLNNEELKQSKQSEPVPPRKLATLLADMQQQIDELREWKDSMMAHREEPRKEKWCPSPGTLYWYITVDFTNNSYKLDRAVFVGATITEKEMLDKYVQAQNCFRTKEAAEEALERIKDVLNN